MTPDEFGKLLDTCGGAPRSWPAGARAGAERLLAHSQTAREALHAQQQVERWLAEDEPLAPPRDFAGRAMQARQLAALTPRGRVLRTGSWAVAAAAAAVFVVALGTATGMAHGRSDDPSQVLTAALSWTGETPDAG